VLQCVAVFCGAWQCVTDVLQCVAASDRRRKQKSRDGTCRHTATQSNTLQHVSQNAIKNVWRNSTSRLDTRVLMKSACSHCDYSTLQYSATHINILQHTAINCITLQYTSIHCSTLQHTATECNTLSVLTTIISLSGRSRFAFCNTLQHTAAHCYTLQHTSTHCITMKPSATHCNTLQHTDTHFNTLQHTTTHCSTL